MSPASKNQAQGLLERCRDLATANELLMQLTPLPTLAMRWGIWDGYSGRPESFAGLPGSEKNPKPHVIADYKEGREIGRRLYMADLPA